MRNPSPLTHPHQHSLVIGVRRDRDANKLVAGKVVPTATEHDVFAVLGLPYRPPEHRNA
jgi:DNA polymerase/3'-5' exonuclease PolX